MPTYEYECSFCAHRFEVFQSMSEERLKECPQCKRQGLERLIGMGSGVIFKGKGFYATDYRKQESASKDEGQDGSSHKPCSSDCCQTSCPLKKEDPSK